MSYTCLNFYCSTWNNRAINSMNIHILSNRESLAKQPARIAHTLHCGDAIV